MTLTAITGLTDPEARRHAKAWFDRFEAAFAGSRQAAASARASLEAHLIEALEGDADADAATVQAALSRLGAPEDLAAEWSAGAPPAPGDAAGRLLSIAVKFVRGVGVALGLIFLLGALARLADPGSVGLFQLENGEWLVGTRNERAVAGDVLGVWTAPLFALAGAGLMAASLGGVRAVKRVLNR
jgi:hypothetical protein